MTMSAFTGRFISHQIFGGGGGGITATSKIEYLLAFVNSAPFNYIISAMKSTVNFEVGQIGKVPVLFGNSMTQEKVKSLTKENVMLSETDWDSYEYSWDFQRHPLVRLRIAGAYAWGDKPPVMHLSSAYNAWKLECDGRFEKLKANEEELNRIFIDIYGLQDELTPEVADKDVTVHRIFDTKDEVPNPCRAVAMSAPSGMRSFRCFPTPWAVCLGATHRIDRGLFLPEEILILYIGNSKDKLLLMNRVIRLKEGMLEFHWRIITTPNSMMQKIGKMLLRFLMSRMQMALSHHRRRVSGRRYCLPPVRLAESSLRRGHAGRKSGLHRRGAGRQGQQQPGDHPQLLPQGFLQRPLQDLPEAPDLLAV